MIPSQLRPRRRALPLAAPTAPSGYAPDYTREPAYHPAGNIAVQVAPGTYLLTLGVEYSQLPAGLTSYPIARVVGNGARFASTLAAALSARDLFPDGGVTFTGSGSVSVPPATPRAITATAVVRVDRATPSRSLRAAMARAVFWSTDIYTEGSATPGTPATPDGRDGGASITAALDGRRAPPVWAANFSIAPAAQNAITPVATQPPAPPVANPATDTAAPTAIVVPARGVSASRLSRAQVQRFQEILTAAGFDTRGANGVIGNNTRSAVTAFQRAWQRTNPALSQRTRDFLAQVPPLGIDGDMGPATQQALAWFATPLAQGGGGLAVTVSASPTTPATRPPATTPATRPPAPTPPSPVRPAPPVPGTVSQAGMGTGSVLLFAGAAAAIGVGIAYRDKLFGGKRGKARTPGYLARRRGRG